MREISDKNSRDEALDINKSFLVQAPAGSGKTYLLITRYLKALLTIENNPDEVIAITFTNKAAEEMRERIIKLLDKAKLQPNLDTSDIQLSLAQQVYKLDCEKKFGIIDNPNLLYIITIDSLCQKIISMQNNFSNNNITMDPSSIYEKAIVEMLSDYENKPWQKSTNMILSHLNNSYPRLQELLVELLSSRDIWLPYITKGNIIDIVNKSIILRIRGIVEFANKSINSSTIPDLEKFLNIYLEKIEHPELELTKKNLELFSTWQLIADFALTKQNCFRKTATSSIGIIAPSSAKNAEEKTELTIIKNSANNLFKEMADNKILLEALLAIKNAPALDYTEYESEIISSLMSLLPVAAAYLDINFHDNQQSDFISKSMECNSILGDLNTPTDFCIKLSNRIKHILVDEFQDTSLSQLNLLKKLIITWEEIENKTLFLVGDPMQSIYKFRQADVGIFTSLINSKLVNTKLNFIQLKTNFRSDPNIVEWTNNIFSKILSKSDLPYAGCVPFNNAVAAKNTTNGNVNCFVIKQDEAKKQNSFIISRVKELLSSDVNDIAILARSRSHIKNLVELFNKEKISVKASEIESLATISTFIDIANLSLALDNKHDRLSWSALLSSPLCGLPVKIIHKITNYNREKTILDIISEVDIPNYNDRIKVFLININNILSKKGLIHPAIFLEQAWLQLGGANLIPDPVIDKTLYKFFSDLSDLSELPKTWLKWQQLLGKNYLLDDNNESSINIMTIHKSKGLEFDHVIIPSFNEGPVANKSKLLNWHQGSISDNDIILGAIPKQRDDNSKMVKYLKHIDNIQLDNESSRLLYVGVTRAIQSIDFISFNDRDDSNNIIVKSNKSFMDKTWKFMIESKTNSIIKVENIEELSLNKKESKKILSIDLLEKIKLKLKNQKIDIIDHKYDFDPISEKQQLGKVIHSSIEKIANIKTTLSLEILKQIFSHIKSELIELNIYSDDSFEFIVSVLEKCLSDPSFIWIMSLNHKNIKNEYVIASIDNKKLKKHVIDRTFICEDNIRWIIDYKTSQPKTTSIEIFLKEQQKLYSSQLQRYGKLFTYEKRKIKLALYFPLCGILHSWDYINIRDD
jgi:ATP-dependent helicase/nuclease subunit A